MIAEVTTKINISTEKDKSKIITDFVNELYQKGDMKNVSEIHITPDEIRVEANYDLE